MASFEIADAKRASEEGGLQLNVKDKGKLTYAGIASAFFPDWEGWEVVNKLLSTLKQGSIIPSLKPLVAKFYRANFWNQIKGDSIVSQDAANGLYDRCINFGLPTGIKMTQEALGIVQSGHMDEATLTELNKQNPF